ncbi:hypothetical protein LB566_04355 [Mesorhizobium sp. CA13]|jgi:hypothetical protein|uniref:hypothetical protein n=1 Tax=unclassified Mesorhizobium TaxID=325217 RepID=UPI001CCCC990|nr:MULTISPECIES: hypothetical protein [unclassified Mesorhizobium]MBZ9853017.1 hypothetical protein [Mesorhizobium sp. CA13]MBZ9964897.1 hypothetical protein [Mesorhizobium sp. BR1-1-2]
MLRLFASLKIFFPVHEPPCGGETVAWLTDPLSHPVLSAMSERELGDMPFRLTARRTAHETAQAGCR